MTTAFRESHAPSTLVLPLQSDPPWLQSAILGIGGAAIATFVALFSRTSFSPALGLLPGIMTGVFAGSALAAWSRRKGATVKLEASNHRLHVSDLTDRHEVLDLTSPYAAALFVDRKPGRRMLVVGQHHDPVVLIETLPEGAVAAPPEWASRTLTLDLDGLALSPASPNVIALARGRTLDPLLAHLAPSLDGRAPLLAQPTAGGPALQLLQGELRFGDRAVALDGGVRAVPYAVQANGMSIAALGLVQNDSAVMLFACEDALVEKGAVAGNLTPDAYVPLAAYELLRAVVDASAKG